MSASETPTGQGSSPLKLYGFTTADSTHMHGTAMVKLSWYHEANAQVRPNAVTTFSTSLVVAGELNHAVNRVNTVAAFATDG
jgi:hypothetical protein